MMARASADALDIFYHPPCPPTPRAGRWFNASTDSLGS